MAYRKTPKDVEVVMQPSEKASQSCKPANVLERNSGVSKTERRPHSKAGLLFSFLHASPAGGFPIGQPLNFTETNHPALHFEQRNGATQLCLSHTHTHALKLVAWQPNLEILSHAASRRRTSLPRPAMLCKPGSRWREKKRIAPPNSSKTTQTSCSRDTGTG